jgi:hypothetical protein
MQERNGKQHAGSKSNEIDTVAACLWLEIADAVNTRGGEARGGEGGQKAGGKRQPKRRLQEQNSYASSAFEIAPAGLFHPEPFNYRGTRSTLVAHLPRSGSGGASEQSCR